MKQSLFAATLLAVLAAGPVAADSYDELNAGIQLWEDAEWERATLHFDKAIAAQELVPSLMRTAYYDRGYSHVEMGQIEQGIADYTAALNLQPDDLSILMERSYAYAEKGDTGKGLSDVAVARAKKPNDIWLRYNAGILELQLGKYQDAGAIFDGLTIKYDKSFQLYNAYVWLWRQLSNIRLGKPSEAMEGGNVWAWPGPIVDFYRGVRSESELLKEAQSDERICEAVFFIAEWRLVHGDNVAARPLLQKAVDECPKTQDERRLARLELTRLP